MSYPGNPSLARDVQQRIVETFHHTLDMAESGSLEEARLGCDFVLRLDPLFAPARSLNDRLGPATGPISVSDLRERMAGETEAEVSAGGAEEAADALELGGPPGIEELSDARAGDLGAELQALFESRKLQDLLARAQAEAEVVRAEAGLRELVGRAQELLEAAPYVETFLGQAREALEGGRVDEAAGFLEKARALDREHPAFGQLEAAMASSSPGVEPSGPSPWEPAAHGAGGGEAGVDELEVPDLDLEALPAFPALEGFESPEEPDSAAPEGMDPVAPAGAAGPSDPDPRIAELLDEGQAAYQRGEFQAAVDAWSRIFLIDIDHGEAARRIDMARDRRAENERQAEEAYHDALTQAEAGDEGAAKEGLQRVLELQGGHAGAREALERLDRGEELVASLPDIGFEGLEGGEGPGELKEEILVPPSPAEAVSSGGSLATAPAGRTFKVVSLGVLVLAVAVGGYFYLNRETWFPNTEPIGAQPSLSLPTMQEQSPIAQAQRQYQEGQRALALARLKRVPPTSPDYQEAQILIGEWDGQGDAEAQLAALSEEEVARRIELLDRARHAAAERRYLEVRSLVGEAATITALEAADEQLLSEAQTHLQELDGLLVLVRDGEHERALRELWQMRQQDPANPDVRTLLVTSYFNRGVLFLQQGRPAQAREALEEAQKLAPQDPEVLRLMTLARAYTDREQDLLYRILVKYLAARSV